MHATCTHTGSTSRLQLDLDYKNIQSIESSGGRGWLRGRVDIPAKFVLPPPGEAWVRAALWNTFLSRIGKLADKLT